MLKAMQKCREQKRKDQFKGYPLRKCHSGFHNCDICKGYIELWSIYRDGGYGQRAHERCVDQLGDEG